MNKEEILEAYSNGIPLGMIIESLNLTHKQVKQVLLKFKEDNRLNRSFTDNFKIIIAERDINGVTRSEIAKELEINAGTVKKACEKFGQSIKDKASSDNVYTRIDGKFEMSHCPSCGSGKNNIVDENITFCMDCDSEHEYYDDHVLKVNFEYLDE